MDEKQRTIRKGVYLAKTSPHRDRGWETDYPRGGSGSQNIRFVKHAANRVYPARVWLANNVQVLRDITTRHIWTGHPLGMATDRPSLCTSYCAKPPASQFTGKPSTLFGLNGTHHMWMGYL